MGGTLTLPVLWSRHEKGFLEAMLFVHYFPDLISNISDRSSLLFCSNVIGSIDKSWNRHNRGAFPSSANILAS